MRRAMPLHGHIPELSPYSACPERGAAESKGPRPRWVQATGIAEHEGTASEPCRAVPVPTGEKTCASMKVLVVRR